MKLAYRYLLAALACFGLLALSLTVGLELMIPFESFWAEIAFFSILFVATAIFLIAGLSELYDEYLEEI
jgi:hypothetical protein